MRLAMNSSAEPLGTVEQALAHAARMLETQPDITAAQAAEVLKAVPGHPVATLLLAAGRRATGDAAGALPLLEPLVKAHPNWPTPHYELASCSVPWGRAKRPSRSCGVRSS